MIACSCGRSYPSRLALPITCVCGELAVIKMPDVDIRSLRRPICDGCQHRKPRDRCGLLPEGRNYIEGAKGLPNPDAYCPDGKWAGPFVRGRVGFLAVSYMAIGGTEVWHQTLIPRLEDVAGFVALEPTLASGPFEKLGCTAAVGLQAARQLAACVDVLVVWGVGAKLGEVLTRSRPRVISVSHCDNRSQWTVDMMQAQSAWTDHCVYLCPTGRDTCPPDHPTTLLPNAPSPERIKPSKARTTIRRELGISHGERVLLSVSRLSPEKRVDRLINAVTLLPDGYRLIVAGSAAGWSAGHADELKAMSHDRVKFVGNVDHPGDLLAASDAFVSASEYEGYGLSMAEAMLSGVPVIATRAGLLETSPEFARLVPMDATAADWTAAIELDFSEQHRQRQRVVFAKRWIDSVDAFTQSWQRLIDEVA